LVVGGLGSAAPPAADGSQSSMTAPATSLHAGIAAALALFEAAEDGVGGLVFTKRQIYERMR